MSKITNKKIIFILVACLMVALVAFSACDGGDDFKSGITNGISGQTAVGNGGIAVQYGDYVYYVNGYQSSNSTNNDYTNEIRTGSIVRVKTSDIDYIIGLNDESSKPAEITKRIAAAVKEKVQLVVPCYYFSANTTNKDLTGLYIFNDRLYITTPNQALTDGGQKKTNQLVLESYKLDGSDRQQHFVFADAENWETDTTALEIMLCEVAGQVVATYVLNGDLHCLKVNVGSASVDTVVEGAEEVTSVKHDVAYGVSYYLDKDGNVCKYVAGAQAGSILVNKETENANETHDYTYTISFVSDGAVYYTRADAKNSTLDGKNIFYADGTNAGVVTGASLTTASTVAWNGKLLRVREETLGETTAKIYHVEALTNDLTTAPVELFNSRYAITLNKVVKGVLHYVIDGVSYTRDLNATAPVDTPYAYNLSSVTSQGWENADVLGKYTFAFGSGTVTVTSFDGEKTNSKATNITLVQETEEA